MKRRRLKKKPVIILAVILILFISLIVSCSCSKKDEIVAEEKQTSFITIFKNSTTNGLNDIIKEKIIDFLDIYYLSLKELNEYNMKYLFKNEIDGLINQAAMNYLINYRLMQRNDLHLTDCSYSLNVSNIKINADEITVTVLEDSIIKFAFIPDIESKSYNVKNIFVFKENNGDYDLISYEKVADYYNIIAENVNESSTIETINNVLEEALVLSKSMVENEINYYNNIGSIPTKKCDHEYDRKSAYEYAIKWVTKRNPEYAIYDEYGGNCQNFASQMLRNGGIPNDLLGFYRFKYYSSNPVDESSEKLGRTPSWTGVNQFYTYAKNNNGSSGLCSLVDINYFYAEKGDVVQFGYKEPWAHSSVVIDVIKKDGKIIDILTNSNTTDRENYPLSAYNYPNKRLIKIYGWND